MKNWISRLFCKHVYHRTRTIHGDEISHRNGARSEWQCCECGKQIVSKDLFNPENKRR